MFSEYLGRPFQIGRTGSTHNLYLSAVYGHITTIYQETVDIVSLSSGTVTYVSRRYVSKIKQLLGI